MTKDILKSLMFKSDEPDVTLYTPAKNQNLTFETIKSYFINYGLKINNDDFEQNMMFFTQDVKYNRLAELFSDKNDTSILVVRFQGTNKNVEIVSDGGLPSNLTEEDYFRGISKPVNEQLLKIFSQLGLIDKAGHGFPLILNTYGKNIFYISKDTIVITIPIDKRPIDDSVNDTPYDKYYDLNNTEKSILKAIEKNSSIQFLNYLRYLVYLRMQ